MPGFIGSNGKFQAFDNNGVPLAGGQLWVLVANSSGFSNLVNSYNDFQNAVNQVFPQSNPVILDSRGEAIVIVNSAVKLVLEAAPAVGQTHGTQIWAINDVAIADAQNTNSGGYKFLNNTISDSSNNGVVTLATETNANSFLELQAHASNNPPELKAICSGTTDEDLWVVPQNNGTVVTTNRLKVRKYDATNSNNITLTATAAGGVPTITLDGTDTNIGCTFSTKGTGALTITNPVNIQGNTGITGVLTNTGNVSVTGNISATGNATISGDAGVSGQVTAGSLVSTGSAVVSANIVSSAGTVQALNYKFTSGSFTTTLNPGTLAANRVYRLPIIDGANKQCLITDGSGNWSFGNAQIRNYFAFLVFTSQTMSAGPSVNTKMTFNAAHPLTLDPNSFLNAGTNRIIPTVAGYYRFKITYTTTYNSTFVGTSSLIQLAVNGSNQIVLGKPYIYYSGANNLTEQNGEGVYLANGSTDYFEFNFFNQDSSTPSGSGYVICELIYAS